MQDPLITLFVPRRARPWNERDALKVGVVVIGRNEGQRLAVCLGSVPEDLPLVYVDSGSTDDSLALAERAEAITVALDMSLPFTAARARNAGAEALLAAHPDLRAIQFLDGDTEMQGGWLAYATGFLSMQTDVAAVAGRRRERFPTTSVYNEFCDVEWNTPIGEAKAVGGDALYLVEPFQAAGGFVPDMIAGEEPELCFRLRQNGHRIFRLGHEMTLHDAGITTLSAFWRRAKRAGYAYALSAKRHGRSEERFRVKEARRAMLWGVYLPVIALIAGIVALILPETRPWPLGVAGGVLALYLMKWLRLIGRARKVVSHPIAYGTNLVLANLAEGAGVLSCTLDTLLGRQRKIIEYKEPARPNAASKRVKESAAI